MPFSRNYSFVDRALHYLAFSAPFVQKALGELENDLFEKRLAGVESRNEVFVTGLPRAGTTLILELLYATGEFGSYTYREMPFILAPLLWRRFSKSHRKEGVKAERAHGDGMEVSFDSPEAFEEVIWLAYLRDRIVRDRTLATVPAEAVTHEAAAGLRIAVRKLLAAECGQTGMPLRYLSKNNANISRIDAITTLFPTARVLVVFRDPLAQAGSLMTQHGRFLQEHAQDAFSRRYMKWIGHFEFGANLRPIDFDGWLGAEAPPAVPDATFWLRYWTAAYRHALARQSPAVHLVDFDRLLREPEASLARMADIADLAEKRRFAALASRLRPPTTRPVAAQDCAPDALKAAEDVHERLKSVAV